jgi:hypothetical protein
MDLSNEAHSTLTTLRNATWLNDDLDIKQACKEVVEYLSIDDPKEILSAHVKISKDTALQLQLHSNEEVYEMTYENVNHQGYGWISHLVEDSEEIRMADDNTVFAISGQVLEVFEADND